MRSRGSPASYCPFGAVALSTKMILPVSQPGGLAAVLQVGVAVVELTDLQIVTFAARLIASLRAKLRSVMNSFVWVVMRMFWIMVRILGTAIATKIPATTTVTMSSIRVNPPVCLIVSNGVFFLTNGAIGAFIKATNGIFLQTNEDRKCEETFSLGHIFFGILLMIVVLSPILSRFLQPG